MKVASSILLVFVSCCLAIGQSKPLDLSVGWSYNRADQGSGFANLNGWYGTLTWEATQRVGISFNHQSFWGEFHGSGVNQHVWLGGFTFKLRKGNPKVSPFIQPSGGVTRSSSSGSVEMQPTFQLEAGADITVKGNLSLELIPAEYVYSHSSSFGSLQSYEAAAGLQYSFGK
jgi:hypothetical protein